MLIYILFTYIFMIFLMAMGISVETTAGLVAVAFLAVTLWWIFREFAKLPRDRTPLHDIDAAPGSRGHT